MEEVAGSIPARSTKSLNNLDRASARRHDICVMVCVITRRFGACSKRFHRIALRFHPNVAVSLQHPSADVTRNCHDGRIGCATLRKLGDSAVPEIVKPETRQPRFLCQSPPSRSPAFDVRSRVERSDGVADDSLAAECELGHKSREDVMRRFDRGERLCSAAVIHQNIVHPQYQ